jgi:hypothetical protein
MEAESARLEARRQELDRLIADETAAMRELGVRIQSMRGSPHLATASERLEGEMAHVATRLTGFRNERAESVALAERLHGRIDSRRSGVPDDSRAHIRHAAAPVPPSAMRFNHAAEVWAALSISLLLIGLAVLLLASPSNAWAEAIVLVIAFIAGESVLRGTFVRTINRIAVILALVALVVLFVQYLKLAVVALLIALAVFLLYQRLQEFRA